MIYGEDNRSLVALPAASYPDLICTTCDELCSGLTRIILLLLIIVSCPYVHFILELNYCA